MRRAVAMDEPIPTTRHRHAPVSNLAAEGDEPSAELRSLVAHRPSLWASYLSTVLLVGIVVLMVWQPS